MPDFQLFKARKKWWAVRDLNPRHPPCKGNAPKKTFMGLHIALLVVGAEGLEPPTSSL